MENNKTEIPAADSEFEGRRSFEQLAAQQAVTPVEDFKSLLGRPYLGDESADEFLELLREWRLEGIRPDLPR
ncbi:MAG TPA: hypothetical protein VN841_27385 [Bryobacteraceae bacterium]|nr:hypothetical protein [Bryobacteraceae bacterium]